MGEEEKGGEMTKTNAIDKMYRSVADALMAFDPDKRVRYYDKGIAFEARIFGRLLTVSSIAATGRWARQYSEALPMSAAEDSAMLADIIERLTLELAKAAK